MIRKKSKNPKVKYEIEEILSDFYPNSNDVDIEYFSKGRKAHTYKLILDSKKLFKDILLQPDTYIIKILLESVESDHRLDKQYWEPLNDKEIDRLKILSKYGLIPKIYYIDQHIIIMRYIFGKTLEELMQNLNRSELDYIILKIEKLLTKWHDLGFYHGDLHSENILIDSKKVYFIDPSKTNIKSNKGMDVYNLNYMRQKINMLD